MASEREGDSEEIQDLAGLKSDTFLAILPRFGNRQSLFREDE